MFREDKAKHEKLHATFCGGVFGHGVWGDEGDEGDEGDGDNNNSSVNSHQSSIQIL